MVGTYPEDTKTMLTELYRLEESGTTLVVVNADVPEGFPQPQLDSTWLQFVVAEGIRRWRMAA